MDPITAGALISGGVQLVGQGASAYSTGKQNRKSRKFTREMYATQKADNLDFWNQQNLYNSPKAQMERFKEAGLNPALIYGQGSAGNAGLQTAPTPQKPEFNAPQFNFDATPILLAHADVKVKNAQADNLETQNTVLLEEQLLKRAQTAATMTDTERKIFDLEMERGLAGTTAEYRKEQLREKKTGIDLSLQKNEREAAINSSNIMEAAERILGMRQSRLTQRLQNTKIPFEKSKLQAEIENLRAQKYNIRKDSELKDLEIDLNKKNITKHDPMWARMLAQYLDEENKTFNPLKPFSSWGKYLGKRLQTK